MKWGSIKEIDAREYGEWPIVLKVFVIVFLLGLMTAGWYYYDIQHRYTSLERVEREEEKLRKTFEEKQSRVVNLDLYKQQLADLRESLGVMLRQLPDKAEIAGLLVDVSQSGLASGLEFELFQPQNEITREFYAEKPIRLKVVGTYHEIGKFISAIAAMPRIVTIHNINIKPRGGPSLLQMDAVAKTYRYLEESVITDTKTRGGS